MEQKDVAGAWVVVTAGGTKFIGRVLLANKDGLPLTQEDLTDTGAKSALSGDNIRTMVRKNNGYITLAPAYEYHSQMHRVGEGYARECLVTHPDFVLQHQKMPMLLRVDNLYCLSDMTEDDRKAHMGFLDRANIQIDKAIEASRAIKPGRIHLVK